MDFLNPETLIDRVGLAAGMIVVDFGTGGGHWALAAARRVGETGRVYALDVQKDLLSRVKAQALEQDLNNIEVIWTDLERVGGAKLADGLADAVVVANMLFQTESPYFVAKEAVRVLKSGGRVLVVDWQDNEKTLLGPHPDHILSAVETEKVFSDSGLRLIDRFEASNHHFGLLFEKPVGL